MLALAGRRKSGAVRVEYVIAGVICVALLSGMTAVLVVRFGGGEARPTRVATPVQQPRDTSRQQPSAPAPGAPSVVVEVPSQTVEIPVAPKATDTPSSSTPMVVVIPSGEPTPAAQRTGSTKAYPTGTPPVLSQGSTLRIQAEDFDTGGEGSAYHDTSSRNEGGAYRSSEGADIENSNDPDGGGYVVNAIKAGEWWQYTVRIQDAGDYQLRLRVSRAAWGDAKARLRIDGFDKTGEVSIPSTGSLSSYRTVDAGTLQITSTGTKVFRLEALTGDWNLNWIELGRGGSSTGGVVVIAESAPSAAPAVVVEIPGASNGGAPSKSTQPPAASPAGLKLVAEDDFSGDKVNAKPAGDDWSWGGAGSMTIQTLPNETTKTLRLVDSTRTGDTWIKRAFSARKERIVWSGKIRFGPSADGVGVSLMDGDKPAAIGYISNGQFGAETSGNSWSAIKAANANTWYDLRIEIDIKGKSCTYEFDGVRKNVKLVKDVSQVNSWALMGAGPTIGTVYVALVRVDAK